MREVSLACALVLATTSGARAQDAAQVDAKHYQVLIDNERTRVFHVVVGPGEKVPMHGHPDAIMIPLMIPPTPEGANAPAAIFIPAQRHDGDNPGKTPVASPEGPCFRRPLQVQGSRTPFALWPDPFWRSRRRQRLTTNR